MKRRAFTLIELLVVIAIVGMLSTVASVAMGSARTNARDQKRMSDLKQVSTALELYFDKYGAYPFTGTVWWSTCNGWTGLKGTTGANGWIPNLAPEFIGQLPVDPLRGAGIGTMKGPTGITDVYEYCYIYKSDGTDYKAASHCAAESGPVGSTAPFYKGPANFWVCGDYHFAVYSPGAIGW